MPSAEPRDGPSAMLLSDGTLANHEIIPWASSTSKTCATRLDPGKVLAVPLIHTSLVELLSI